MSEMPVLQLEKLIRLGSFDCLCGERHATEIRYLKLGSGVLASVPEVLKAMGVGHPMVICGPHGYEAAGRDVCRLLEESATAYSLHIVPEENESRIKPAEFAAGSILLSFDHACDAVLAVGSGVINDLGKVLSRTAKLPYIIVATAPSMDGYASDSSSVERGGIKHSLKEQTPAAIICDTRIMAHAPMRMLHAGLGDILAKYTALCDWKISHLVTGEPVCPTVVRLVENSLEKTVRGARGLLDRNEDSVRDVTEGLVLSGIGITYAGCSHPASGLEHYFSHCWEMMKLERGEECELHGIQVGVGMLLTLKIIERLKTVRPDLRFAQAAAERFDAAAWEENLRRVFPKAADGLLKLERKARKNDCQGRLRRAERIVAAWEDILTLLEALPSYEEAKELMCRIGMPTSHREIGLTAEDVVDAFVCSRDIRDKYLLSSLIWDLGYMEDFAHWLGAQA